MKSQNITINITILTTNLIDQENSEERKRRIRADGKKHKNGHSVLTSIPILLRTMHLELFQFNFFFSEQLKTFPFKSISPLIFHVKSIFVHYNKTEIVGLILSLQKKKFLPVSEHFLPRTFCILSQTQLFDHYEHLNFSTI